MKSRLDVARLAVWTVGGQSRTLGVKSLSSSDKRFEGGCVVSLDDLGVVYVLRSHHPVSHYDNM